MDGNLDQNGTRSKESLAIYPSQIPSALQPDSSNVPEANTSSHEVRTGVTSLGEFSMGNSPSPPMTPEYSSSDVHGIVDHQTSMTPAASVSRPPVSTTSVTTSRTSIGIREEPAGAETSMGFKPSKPQLVQDLETISAPKQDTEGNGHADGRSQGYNVQVSAPIGTADPVGNNVLRPLRRGPLGGKNLGEVCRDFVPMAPEVYCRYKEDLIDSVPTKYKLPPRTTDFQEESLPYGWREFLHPEGPRYFLYEAKKIYTEADIHDPDILRHAKRLIAEFDGYIKEQDVTLPGNINIAFDLSYQAEDDSCRCQYYIADHSTRTVFWLDEYDADKMQVWSEVTGVTKLTHIRHAIEAEYWYHCVLFPSCFRLGAPALDELRDTLIYWIGDVMTSITTAMPVAIDELRQMLDLTNDMRNNIPRRHDDPPAQGLGCVAVFARQRFLDFHGQDVVRLEQDRPIHRAGPQNSSWLLRCLSWIMLFAPDSHLRELRKIWVDHLVHDAAWNRFLANRHEEWQQLNLLGTVILNADVAFLAIQSVDEGTNSPNRSPAQVLTFLSVVSSIGSVLIGLMLIRKQKMRQREGAMKAAIFLNAYKAERLAVLYSCPYALLMWGLVLFLLAFSFYCLDGASLSIRLIVPGAWFIILILAVWCIFNLASWDLPFKFSAQRTPGDKVILAFQNTAKAIKTKMIALGIRKSDPEPQVLILPLPKPSPAKKLVDIWRKAARIAAMIRVIGSPRRISGREANGETEVQTESPINHPATAV
ncbi:hypothetical protein PQX77_011697 [Marasmius sp. AFHP31]|nr:hypothetical protein PQX77_011697 [Marasmius sp. AFHP31]